MHRFGGWLALQTKSIVTWSDNGKGDGLSEHCDEEKGEVSVPLPS